MDHIRSKISEQFGSVRNFESVITRLVNMGANVLPMLRTLDKDLDWKFASGQVIGVHPGTVWVVKDFESNSLKLVFHKGRPVRSRTRVINNVSRTVESRTIVSDTSASISDKIKAVDKAEEIKFDTINKRFEEFMNSL